MQQRSNWPESSDERLLRLSQVEARTGLKKSSIYELQRRGEFPRSVKLSRRAVCWPESAVNAWIADRIKSGRDHGQGI